MCLISLALSKKWFVKFFKIYCVRILLFIPRKMVTAWTLSPALSQWAYRCLTYCYIWSGVLIFAYVCLGYYDYLLGNGSCSTETQYLAFDSDRCCCVTNWLTHKRIHDEAEASWEVCQENIEAQCLLQRKLWAFIYFYFTFHFCRFSTSLVAMEGTQETMSQVMLHLRKTQEILKSSQRAAAIEQEIGFALW